MLKLLTENTQKSRMNELKKQLAHAQNYQEWKEIALQLDEESGIQQWKYENSSPYFDAEVISYRLGLLKKYRQQNRSKDLMHILREGLTYDIANICHPMLFVVCYMGTKKIIEEYVNEVHLGLQYLAQVESAEFNFEAKISFFRHCKIAYGQPALMFSGGATLGLFHSGVCKVLREQDLMPNVLSGSSAGAIIAAMLGVSEPEQTDRILTGQHVVGDAFHFRSLKTLLKERGGFADVRHLKRFLVENLGDFTFEEAYKRSGLNINIAVAPYDASQNASILNRFTAPDLLVWSATLASCAVPILFPPIRLTAKRYDGTHTPFMANTFWVDGSMRSDFPQEKMSRLYNINYTIASQANPHIVPFMQSDAERYRRDLLSWPERIIRRQGKVITKGIMDFTRERIGYVPQVRRLLDNVHGIVDQRYYGDVNIFAHHNLKHYLYLLQNPRPHIFQLLQKEGERATWPKVSAIEIHARIGKTIEHVLDDLQAQEKARLK
ncbi:DUF3336 domain-containing protein [Acinetobacter sp. MD2(2019)]|uniref:DUF3336 domain-containing protein n=1 Tax=Acinetobacter sp. MD2(2019) TaxID=2605273 RepID=UPI002D1F54DF|nr:DUF3336 domain-containing protein [Acinetobacter sp. MD2(2019)]MEB3754782.1 DUF3336 domain-containing protein [Acinetobacter sp. MD2(2019)]